MIRMFKNDGGYKVFNNEDDVYKHIELGWEIVDEDHGKRKAQASEVAITEEPKKRGRKPK